MEYKKKVLLYKKLQHNLWILTGLTFPLFSVSFLRIDIPYIHLAIPQILILLIGAIGISIPSKISNPSKLEPIYRNIILLFMVFILWHFIMLSFSSDIILGFKNALKLLISFISFVIVLVFFPRDTKLITRFIMSVSIGMVLLLMPLLYRYAIYFKATYLSSDWEQESRWGKNQLAYFISRFTIFPLVSFWQNPRSRGILIAPLLIFLLSILYTSSRGSWLSMAIGIIAIILILQKYFGLSHTLKKTFILILQTVFLILATLFILSHLVNIHQELTYRAVSIVKPSELPESKAYLGKYSYENRGTRARQAIDGWLTSPIIGVGLSNAEDYSMGLIHNDYLAILLELGIIGLILYISIIYLITRRILSLDFIKNTNPPSCLMLSAIGSLAAQIFISNVFDSYQSSYYWIFMALYLVIYETEKSNFLTGKSSSSSS